MLHILYTVHLALRHRRMLPSAPWVTLSGALLVGLTLGCGSAVRPSPADMPEPSPSRPLAGATVTSDDFDRSPTQSIERTLQGRVSGVTIVSTPDGGIALRIRGATTINGNTEPLFVIDGLPVQADRKSVV